ncbi:MAG: four-carbon acid sugar kinase family protein [Actinomycetota bacterium]|nr:four-carbon acid sugar kinase family protein [Actinomycetota bacterium]
MRPILCLADDLTGGASLAAGGGEMGDPARIGFTPGGAGILDLGMRDLPPERIQERIVHALARQPEGGDAIVALRIDSGGLSPVGLYIEAALGGLGPGARAFVMPVHPGAGRGYAHGSLRLGEELRPFELSVRGAPPEIVPLEHVRSPELGQRLPAGQAVMFEGITQRDVSNVAAAVRSLPGPLIVADPGPLTLALRRLELPPVRLLAVVGSTSELTREQVFASQEMLGLHVVRLDVDAALEDERALSGVVHDVAAKLSARSFVGVVTSSPEPGAAPEGEDVSRLLGKVAADVVHRGLVDALYLSGGHVAKAVCEALGATGLTDLREMDVLSTFGRLEGGVAPGMPVGLKGGGIGDRSTMVRLLERLDWFAASGALGGRGTDTEGQP